MSKRGPDRAGGQGGFNKRRSHGKPMLKMLCPYYCAGAIIGKGGETIKELMDKTDCDVKISKNDERFPTTSERVISVQGDQSSVEECMLFCQGKIRNDEPPPNAKRESHAINAKRKEACKLVVSDTSAGRIIGKGGQRIKDLKNDYSVVINITRKDELPRGFEERCVSVEGEDGNVDNCVKEIVKLVCEDDSASMEWHVFYNDWSERREERGFGGGRDMGRDGGRDSYGGGGGGRDYGGRDSYGGRDDRDSYGGGGRDGYSRDNISDRRDSFQGRDGRDSYSGGGGGGGGRDYGRESRDYRDPRDDRGYSDDRGYGGGRDQRDSGRDGYGRDDRDRGYGGGRDAGYARVDDRIDDRRNDSFGGGRDAGYGGGGRDNYRDGGRNSFGGGGGGGGGGGYNDRGSDRRDDFARDGPRGGGRY